MHLLKRPGGSHQLRAVVRKMNTLLETVWAGTAQKGLRASSTLDVIVTPCGAVRCGTIAMRCIYVDNTDVAEWNTIPGKPCRFVTERCGTRVHNNVDS